MLQVWCSRRVFSTSFRTWWNGWGTSRTMCSTVPPRGPKSLIFKSRARNRRFVWSKRPPCSLKSTGKVGGFAPHPSPWVFERERAVAPPPNTRFPGPIFKTVVFGPPCSIDCCTRFERANQCFAAVCQTTCNIMQSPQSIGIPFRLRCPVD